LRTFDNEQSGGYDAGDDASSNTFVNTVILRTQVDHGQVTGTWKYSRRRRKRTCCLNMIDSTQIYRPTENSHTINWRAQQP